MIWNGDNLRIEIYIFVLKKGGARGVIVIVAGYGHGDTNSNPRLDWMHFT